jgi:hypothetical protein
MEQSLHQLTENLYRPSISAIYLHHASLQMIYRRLSTRLVLVFENISLSRLLTDLHQTDWKIIYWKLVYHFSREVAFSSSSARSRGEINQTDTIASYLSKRRWLLWHWTRTTMAPSLSPTTLMAGLRWLDVFFVLECHLDWATCRRTSSASGTVHCFHHVWTIEHRTSNSRGAQNAMPNIF